MGKGGVTGGFWGRGGVRNPPTLKIEENWKVWGFTLKFTQPLHPGFFLISFTFAQKY